MKVLLITSIGEDYLQDSLIHGFKELLGTSAVDYPTKYMLYNDFDKMSTIRGNGFTLYGLIDHNLKSSDTIDVKNFIKNNYFDKIIFTSIFRQYDLFYSLYPLLKGQNVWVVDGEDTDLLFPYLGKFKKLFFKMAIKPHKQFIYFKRELTVNTIRSYYYRLIPHSLASHLKLHKNIRPIAFSIPREKIISAIPDKNKLFAEHIVDTEVAEKLYRKNTSYAFSSELEYYQDIQKSKFGITTKRAGWDCLRHYEIAANGTVMCFKDLDKKPLLCAPHGLIDGFNCISYSNYDDLMSKITNLSEDNYVNILNNSLDWVKSNSTLERVKELIKIKN